MDCPLFRWTNRPRGQFGAEEPVLCSLAESFPGIDWPQQASYFFSLVVGHGKRRTGERRESARTVGQAGRDPWMPGATANGQQWVAQRSAAGVFDGCAKDAGWQVYADCMLVAIAAGVPAPCGK